ncbi:hypothetical protein B0G76_2625 [Paraburkholderia sp. BL23I1N1]|nr:hypothetical protein B0G76_2625 [Paraburkholderia sp. BL23I1N1]
MPVNHVWQRSVDVQCGNEVDYPQTQGEDALFLTYRKNKPVYLHVRPEDNNKHLDCRAPCDHAILLGDSILGMNPTTYEERRRAASGGGFEGPLCPLRCIPFLHPEYV